MVSTFVYASKWLIQNKKSPTDHVKYKFYNLQVQEKHIEYSIFYRDMIYGHRRPLFILYISVICMVFGNNL